MTAALKIPGPDHRISIKPSHERIRVRFNGKVIAETSHALELDEAGYRTVRYFPRSDVDMAFFERTTRITYCPYKGDANYFSLVDGAARAENAVWTYEHPSAAVAAIARHLAFYPARVEIETF